MKGLTQVRRPFAQLLGKVGSGINIERLSIGIGHSKNIASLFK